MCAWMRAQLTRGALRPPIPHTMKGFQADSEVSNMCSKNQSGTDRLRHERYRKRVAAHVEEAAQWMIAHSDTLAGIVTEAGPTERYELTARMEGIHGGHVTHIDVASTCIATFELDQGRGGAE